MASSMARSGTRDMFLTMAVFMIPLALIVWFFQSAGQERPQVPEADWKSAVADARAAGSMEVLAPKELPAGWQATKASWLAKGQTDPQGVGAAGDTLELGFLNDRDEYLALNQTLAPSAAYLKKATRDGYQVGPVEVDGATWTHYQSADDRTHSLVLVDGPVTRVLSSDAGLDALRELLAVVS